MTDETTAPAATTAGDAAKKAKRDERKKMILDKARDAATKSGKEWSTLSKEDRQTFRKAARTDMRADKTERKAKREAKKAAAGKTDTAQA